MKGCKFYEFNHKAELTYSFIQKAVRAFKYKSSDPYFYDQTTPRVVNKHWFYKELEEEGKYEQLEKEYAMEEVMKEELKHSNDHNRNFFGI